jgi:hypothetical protein
MARNDTPTLLSEIEAFLVETGMGETYFGKRAANDSGIVARLRAGATPITGKPVFVRPEAAAAVRKFMRAELKRRQVAA